MTILQRYTRNHLLWLTMLALFALVSLFAFFTLIDQLEDTGRGSYGITEAVIYTLLTTPRLAYELFPIAMVIAGMALLGMLARNGELDVIYTSGVSRMRFALILAKASILLILLCVVIGEMVAPASEERAQNLRSMSLTEQISLRTRNGFWIRDGNSYVNIRRVLPDSRIEDIYFYQFDQSQNLQSSARAGSAVHSNGRWQLHDIRETAFTDHGVTQNRIDETVWDSLLDPEIINILTIKPQYLTLIGLIDYIRYLRLNAQNSLLFEQALWAKLVKPFSLVGMLLLAVTLVRTQGRSVAIGQRVFIGTLAGILFHLLSQVSTNLGVVYHIHPLLSVAVPTVLLFLLIAVLLRN